MAAPLLYGIALLFGFAALFIAAAQLAGRMRGPRVWKAFATEFATVAAVVAPAWQGGFWLCAALMLLALACARELYAALARSGDRPVTAVGLALNALAVGLGVTAPMGLAPAIAALALALAALRWPRLRARDALRRAASTLLGVLYPGLCVGCLAALALREGGFGYAVFAFALVEINDSAAYLIGASIGRRRPFPRLSPQKTLAGSVAGVAAALAASSAFAFLVPQLSGAERWGAGALLAIGGPAGDLLASAFKRRAGVKDFGNRIPVAGGILDVYDSFILVSPLLYLYLRALNV